MSKITMSSSRPLGTYGNPNFTYNDPDILDRLYWYTSWQQNYESTLSAISTLLMRKYGMNPAAAETEAQRRLSEVSSERHYHAASRRMAASRERGPSPSRSGGAGGGRRTASPSRRDAGIGAERRGALSAGDIEQDVSKILDTFTDEAIERNIDAPYDAVFKFLKDKYPEKNERVYMTNYFIDRYNTFPHRQLKSEVFSILHKFTPEQTRPNSGPAFNYLIGILRNFEDPDGEIARSPEWKRQEHEANLRNTTNRWIEKYQREGEEYWASALSYLQ
jgi:hypothetical protein